MATLGSLIVTLEANIAKFESDLGRAATVAEARMNEIARSVGKVSEAFGFLAAGFGVEQIAHFGMSLIEATAQLGHLSAATGLSVEALSALKATAAGVGVDIDSAAMAFERMEKAAGLAEGGSKKIAGAFAAIGISTEDLKKGMKEPDALFLKVAQSLEKFRDDGNKTAIMMTILGKGGAQMAALMKELAANGYEAANATAEQQAAQAEAYEKMIARVSTSIKTWSRDLVLEVIPAIQLFGASVITYFSDMWIEIKYGGKLIVEEFVDEFKMMDNWVKTLSSNTRKFLGMKELPKFLTDDSQSKIPALRAEEAAQLKLNEAIRAEAAAAFVDATSPAVKVKGKDKPSAGLYDPNADKRGGNDGLIKEMDERLKIIADAIKREDELTKLANMSMDHDYAQGNVDLAAYSEGKRYIFEKNYRLVQSLYDSEIALGKSYITRLSANLAKETDVKVKARLASELATASAKTQHVEEEKGAGQIKYLEDQIKDTDAMAKKQEALAKTIIGVNAAYATLTGNLALAQTLQSGETDRLTRQALQANSLTTEITKLDAVEQRRNQLTMIAQDKPIVDTNVAYLQLIGNTEAATRLQIAQNDEMIRYELTARNATAALAQLGAVEADRMMRASKDGFVGMQRAVLDYRKGLEDVAKSTEAMTTKMLTSMEDALVSFVETGKLNWKSLINSMIDDIVRLLARQAMMQIFSMAMGGMGGVASGAAGAVGGGGTASLGGAMAMGGPVNAGQTYTVGERGPEQFVPSVQGSIVPNGGGSGAQTITYAPTIQIDSRSDRAQVQADTMNAVRQGQKELMALLLRYNPGLRA